MLQRSEYDAFEEAQALRRWKEGHQALHVYLVIINTVIGDATEAIRFNDSPKISSCLGRLAVLYDAATATMQYSADFSPQLYENVVRPSMAPPLLPPGFSGMLNTEHCLMVAEFKNLSRALRESYGHDPSGWPPGVAGRWASVQLAKVENLKRHKVICSRFVAEGESLLRQALQSNSG